MISSENNNAENAHQKHTKLTRPAFGMFGRNEWAFVGGRCEDIKRLADEVIKGLSSAYKCAYVDSVHDDEQSSLPARLSNGAVLEYTDHQDHSQLNSSLQFNTFKRHEMFASADLVLVNGNHHQAKAHVVIISNAKKSSLQKRIDQLTDVQLLLLENGETEIFDFIKDDFPHLETLPVYQLNETEKIIAFFQAQMQLSKPALRGLVLAGGESIRMGMDKAMLKWHGKEQQYYLADLLAPFCDKVYISCRPDQQNAIQKEYKSLPDTFTGLGPFGAILSAFRENPGHAWLVVACDLPLVDQATLLQLTENRNPSAIATAFKSNYRDFPEPLITIWEPKSYPVLLSFLAQGYNCPRKVLINSYVAILNANNTEALSNVNTPEDFEQVKKMISHRLPVE